jgi:hypothetical protein
VGHGLGSGLAASLVDDLLLAGNQLSVGKGVQHRPGPEEVVEVTVGHEDRAGSLASVPHPRGQPLPLVRGEQRVDEDRVAVSRDQRRGAGRPRGRVVSFHPGPPGICLYPLLKTSIDNDRAMLTPLTL